MRVLILSDTPFVPATAGNRRRLLELIGFLRDAGVEVGMLMLPAVDRHEWDEAAMRRGVTRFEVAERPLAAKVLRRLRAAVGAVPAAAGPVDVDGWCPSWFRARARRVADDWAADVVIAEYVYLSACLADLSEGTLRVIDTLDVMHRRAAVYVGAGMAPQWFHTSREDERRGLERADLVLAIHDEEAAELRAMVPSAEVLTVPHGLAADPLPPAAARPGRLLFAASYNDLNVLGMCWLVERVWPEMRRAWPAVELHVCGSIAEKLPPMPAGVTVRGVVPSLRDEYAAARVVLDPVAWGTGQPIKVVEALAHGRPVVSRRPGPPGLDDAVIVGADERAFAAGVLTLLSDDARWLRMAAAAAQAAAQSFSPEAVFGPLLARLRAGR